MLVTTWLRSTGADVPLLLQTDQATVIDGPPSGFTTMSDIYFQLLEFAKTLATTGQDELNQMLMWAKGGVAKHVAGHVSACHRAQ